MNKTDRKCQNDTDVNGGCGIEWKLLGGEWDAWRDECVLSLPHGHYY